MRARPWPMPRALLLLLLWSPSMFAGACLSPPQGGGSGEEVEDMAEEVEPVEMGAGSGLDLGGAGDAGTDTQDAASDMPGPPSCAASLEEQCRALECGASVLVCEQGDPTQADMRPCPCELVLSWEGPGSLLLPSAVGGEAYRLETELGARDELTLERCTPEGACTPCETFEVTPPALINRRQGALPPGDSWVAWSGQPLRLLGPTESPISLTLECAGPGGSGGAAPLQLELSVRMPADPGGAPERWEPRLWLRAHADIFCEDGELCDGATSMTHWRSSPDSELGPEGELVPMPRAHAEYIGVVTDPLVERLGGLPYVSISLESADAAPDGEEDEGGLAPTGEWLIGGGGAPTIFAVVRSERTGSGRGTLLSNCPDAPGAEPGQYQIAYEYVSPSSSSALEGVSLISRPSSAQDPQANLYPFPGDASAREFHLITIGASSSRQRWVVRRNGLEVSPELSGGEPLVPTGGWWLNRFFGTCYASEDDVEFEGDVAELLVSDEELPVGLTEQIERYLMRKYELARPPTGP